MKIKQTKIRNINKVIGNIKLKQDFVIGVEMSSDIKDILKEKFYLDELVIGTELFPSPLIGIMSRRNSIGEYIPQKDKEQEIAYRALDWHLKDWGGYDHYGTNYVPYQRYPRKFIQPKELKLLVTESGQDKIIIINNSYKNIKSNYEEIKFATNLILEIFGEAKTFIIDENNEIIDIHKIESIHWEILPKGEKVWETCGNSNYKIVSKSKIKMFNKRFELIKRYNPNSIKQGTGGYTGYLVFEFKNKNIYIFDSIIYGNATYIFEGEWENVSKLTKKEIISNDLQKDRIIHNDNWEKGILKYLV